MFSKDTVHGSPFHWHSVRLRLRLCVEALCICLDYLCVCMWFVCLCAGVHVLCVCLCARTYMRVRVCVCMWKIQDYICFSVSLALFKLFQDGFWLGLRRYFYQGFDLDARTHTLFTSDHLTLQNGEIQAPSWKKSTWMLNQLGKISWQFSQVIWAPNCPELSWLLES